MAGGPERTKRTSIHPIHPLFNRSSSQSSRISDPNDPSSQQCTFNNEEIIPDASKSTKSSITTSWIWKHGDLEKVGKERRWQCKYCSTNLSAATTSSAVYHLKTHRIHKDGQLSSDQPTIEACIKPAIDPEVLRKLIVEWVIDRRHAFNEVEAESFRKIIQYLDNTALSKLPHSGNTIRSDCFKYFKEAKLVIKELLSTARSQIHLSFDLSTSPNCKALLAVTAHWTSSTYKAEATLLAIRELEKEHTGENIAQSVYDVIKDYNIVNNLGYFIMDNASNNDTALKELSSLIIQDGGTGFDPVERRLRCFGHIINLAVKDLLYGPKKKKGKRRNNEQDYREGPDLDDEVPGHDDSDNDKRRKEALRKAWRALGVVGKAHNIVLWVRGKPQHRSAWKNKRVKQLRNELLQADNATRWGSTWNMLHVFLRQRERIEEYVDAVPELKDDQLTESDWKDLKDVLRLLEPFKKLTVLGEERGTLYGSVGSVLWGFDILLEKLEKERKKSRPSDTPYQRALDASWAKLCKYYKLTDESSVYVIAGMLDPRMKYQYFEHRWESEWLAGVMDKMRSTFNQYREKEPTPDMPQILSTMEDDDDDNDSLFDFNKWRFGNMQQVVDELTRYLTAPVLTLGSAAANDTFSALAWWKGNAIEYPTLAQIAFNIFSIPSMSVEPERVFSGHVLICDHTDCRCNLTITDLRNRLGADTVEAIECLKWWIKGGFIKEVLKSLVTDEKDDLMDQNEDLIGDNEVFIDEEEDLYG